VYLLTFDFKKSLIVHRTSYMTARYYRDALPQAHAQLQFRPVRGDASTKVALTATSACPANAVSMPALRTAAARAAGRMPRPVHGRPKLLPRQRGAQIQRTEA
jgi:hypothetical protein